jgi:zinc protease
VPDVERVRLEGGLPVHVIRLPRLPVVSAAFVFKGAGETAVAAAQAGRATLTAAALEGGTRKRSGTALAEALEEVGADVSVQAGWDSTVASVSCLTDRWADGLDLLAEMVLAPAFPEVEVDRARDQALAGIRQREKDPGALAAYRAAGLFYAPGEAYGRSARGDEASVSGLDREALVRFAADTYRPDGAGLVVVGDVDRDEVIEVAQGLLAGWEGAAPVPAAPSGQARFDHPTIHVVHRPGAVQSELRLGHPGAARSTADYSALVVANAILGGTFGSRLNMNLRESKGFTYGVRSSFGFRRGPGPFTVSTAVDTDVTAAAVREAVGELDRYVREGPTDDEVRSVRDYIAGVFPLRLETTGRVAGRLAELMIHELPDDAWTRYRDDIRAVDVGSAHEAARRHIHVDRLTTVIVGDADVVADELRALDLGPVTVHTD